MHILYSMVCSIYMWYMYCTLYILHMYHMYYMQQCVMPLHNIDVLYDMMYRQYITSHITCVVLHDIYTVPCSSMCSILMVYTCTTALYIYICNVCKSICIHVYTYVWSSVLYDVLHTQYLHRSICQTYAWILTYYVLLYSTYERMHVDGTYISCPPVVVQRVQVPVHLQTLLLTHLQVRVCTSCLGLYTAMLCAPLLGRCFVGCQTPQYMVY